MPLIEKKKMHLNIKPNFELFLQTLIKSDIIWTRIGQVIDINFSETVRIFQMISIFLKQPVLNHTR